MSQKLRMGMVGGGPGAFIGPVHKMAAELDGKIELVAGAFSQSPERSRVAGASFGIDPARAYASYAEMFEAESKREDGIDFVVIATPNNLHLPVAEAALAAGIAVMSDKPATATYDEVLTLEAVVEKGWLALWIDAYLCGILAGAGGAHAMCERNLGSIRKIAVEYLQGWLSRPIEVAGQKQAAWRSDPALNGPGGCIGDIGTHAFHLTEYVTGLKVTSLNAALRSVVAGRRLDDDCNAASPQQRCERSADGVSGGSGGAKRHAAPGVWGRGVDRMAQDDPNQLSVKWLDRPEEIRHAGGSYLSSDALTVTRLPGGHPEGYIEAFAVLYREFAEKE
jgi:predicted dehydrogenase